MENVARFWDKKAESYAKQPVADEAAYQKKLEVTRDYLRPDMNVIEFGCGTGSTAIVHAPYVKQIRATDISQEMINIAKEKANAKNINNVSFECATIEELEVPNQSVDVVLALSVLHLLEDKEVAIEKIFKMLKPGGIFASSTVCIADFMKLMKWVAPVGYFLGVFPLLKVFSKQDLENSLVAAGFKVEYQWQPHKSKGVFMIAQKPSE